MFKEIPVLLGEITGVPSLTCYPALDIAFSSEGQQAHAQDLARHMS